MMKLLLLLAAAAPLFAQQPCTYTVTPASPLNIGAGAYTTDITVTAGDGCLWTYGIVYITNSPAWLTFSNGPKSDVGNGNGTVTLTASANVFASERVANVVLIGRDGTTAARTVATIAITQAAQACTLAPQPPTLAGMPVTGGSAAFDAQTNCFWAASGQSWITVAPTSGTATTTVKYTVAPNGCVAPRRAPVNLSGSGGQTFSLPVTQDGSAGNLTLSFDTATAASTLTTGRVNISTGLGCPWTSYSDVSWLQIAGAASGNSNGGISYSVLENAGPQRVGHLYLQSGVDLNGSPIQSKFLTVTQQAAPAPVQQLTAIVNAASYASGPVSPGEMVALGGSNLGPVAGVAYNQTFATLLGGVQVLFGSVAAPLLYVSSGQINAVVPYAVSGPNVTVQVIYNNSPSNTLTVPVQDATPGIFSVDKSGTGQGAILNQNYDVNSGANRAAAGSYVMIYGTGAGVTTPASKDGELTALTPPFPELTQQVSVTIGGLPAPVVYSGPAPGAVAGLTQINVQVPAGVAANASVPLVVKIGSWQSQNGITLAVK